LVEFSAPRRVQVELVLTDHQAEPGGHAGHEHGQAAERHRLRMRLPVRAPLGNALERAARPARLGLQLFLEHLDHLHGSPLVSGPHATGRNWNTRPRRGKVFPGRAAEPLLKSNMRSGRIQLHEADGANERKSEVRGPVTDAEQLEQYRRMTPA